MKATGIVRRIDDLGRITIPKELMRTLGFAEGDPMEILTDDGWILLRRYQCNEDIQGAVTVVDRLLQSNKEQLKNPAEIIKAFRDFQDALNGQS